MARLYANENFPFQCVEELRRLGHDVLTEKDSGQAGVAWPDHEVLRFATAENRAVIIFNRRHFIKLHLSSPLHAGIIVCTFDSDFDALAQRVQIAVNNLSQLAGVLVRINLA